MKIKPIPGSVRQGFTPVLDWKLPAILFFFIAVLFAPIAIWFGWGDPSKFIGFMSGNTHWWARDFAIGCAAALLILPMLWIWASGTLDLFALFLSQNALLICGYFFLNTTAWRMTKDAPAIIDAGPLVVLINTLGFASLFATMGATYFIAAATRARVPPLYDSPGEYDARLIWMLRAVGLGAAAVIALPMAATGTIPLLAPDPVQARFAMVKLDAARALYHAGTAVLPFVTGGLLMWILRRPARILAIDGWIVGGIVVLQILTSNRLPLAITMFVTLALATLEKRLPRLLLVLGVAAFMFIFVGLSGFTAILRQDRSALEGGNVASTSLKEAFLGDNLIDLRDAAWVYSHWDFEPLNGRTYLGGLAAFVPSGIFPLKKQWHLGLTAIRIVGWDPEKHFGLRITFFGESFLNFGPAGVVGLGAFMGCLFGILLRLWHLVAKKKPPCLHYNLKIIILMQMCLPLSNSSDAFTFWAMATFLAIQWMWVDLFIGGRNTQNLPAAYAVHRS